MSHEGGPEQPQRTVAELLAKYGAESGERTPRRRRRRADDMEDTGAQAIIERVLSESGEMQAIREDTPPPERTSHRRGAAAPSDYRRQPPPPQQPPAPSPQPRRRDQSSQSLPRPLPPQPSRELPRPQPQPGPSHAGPPSLGRMPAISRPSEPTTPVHGGGPPRTSLPQRQQPSQQLPRPVQPGNRTGVQPTMRSRLEGSTDAAPPPPPPPPMPAPPVESVTEELPRVPGRIPVDGSGMGRRPGGDSRTHLTPPPYPPPRDLYAEPEADDYRDPYPQAEQDRGYEPDAYDSAEYDNFLDEDELADEDGRGRVEELDDVDDDLDDEDTERSPAKEWAVMAGQLALGVLGGAAVWLGFNWLWGFLPQAALVVALAVIVGLVLIVRKIRRAEDLQTTVLAVLVGLVVTVSPAALLLLNK